MEGNISPAFSPGAHPLARRLKPLSRYKRIGYSIVEEEMKRLGTLVQVSQCHVFLPCLPAWPQARVQQASRGVTFHSSRYHLRKTKADLRVQVRLADRLLTSWNVTTIPLCRDAASLRLYSYSPDLK